jgi:preprotein translocase SecE subunit
MLQVRVLSPLNFSAARPVKRNEVENIKNFVIESYQELRKVTWPGQKEILASSFVVVVVTAISVLLIVAADKVIELALNAIFK